MLLVALVCPTIQILSPIQILLPRSSSRALSRPLYELFDFGLVGMWLGLWVFRPKLIAVRPRWLQATLFLYPAAFFVSTVAFAQRGGALELKHYYALINSLRPVALVALTVALARWGRLADAQIDSVNNRVVFIVAVSAFFVSGLTLLQTADSVPAQDFLHTFYTYENIGWQDMASMAIENYGRATSIFRWANSLGMFLALTLLLLLPTLAWGRRSRLIMLVPVLTCLVALVLSGSRSGLIALTVGIAIVFLAQRQARMLILVGIVVLAVVAGMSLVEARTGNVSRFTELFDYVTERGPMPYNLAGRLTNTGYTLTQFSAHARSIWTGTTVTEYDSLIWRSFDNEYLKHLVWNGILGLIAFVGFEVGIMAYVLRLLRRGRELTTSKLLTGSLAGMVVAMAITAYSQDVWSQPKVMHLVLILLGILVYVDDSQTGLPPVWRPETVSAQPRSG